MKEAAHAPVLLAETIAGLNIQPDGIYVDATFGRGGHSSAILKRLGPKGQLLAIDQDPEAVLTATQGPWQNDPRFSVVHASFDALEAIIVERGLQGKVNGVMLDLGVSSPQLDDATRGFSFLREGPLDMRMNNTTGMDAATWINKAEPNAIATVLREYGEERFAKRIANAIIQRREDTPIITTTDLAELIAAACPVHDRHKHPATRSFQAIRIFINRELDLLKACLVQCLAVLAVNGRMCVISFHSLEDRIVKRFIQRESQTHHYPSEMPLKDSEMVRRLRKVGKLVIASATELENNLRARSARLRIAEKIA